MSDIEGQHNCEIKDDEETLQVEQQTLWNELNATFDNMSRYAKCIQTTALFNEIPTDIENVRKYKESHFSI